MMDLPRDLEELVLSKLSISDKYVLGCTCKKYKCFRGLFKRRQFLGRGGIFAQYNMLKEYLDQLGANHYELPDVALFRSYLGKRAAEPVLETCRALFWGSHAAETIEKYRFLDPELCDIVLEELKLSCADEVLILSFFMKIHRYENV